MFKKINLSIAILIFLTACGSNLSYKSDLPQEPNTEMLDFIGHLVSDNKYSLIKTDGNYVFTKKNRHPNDHELEYVTYTNEKINQMYTDFLKIDEEADSLDDFREKAEDELFQKIDQPTDYSLPIIQKLKGNILHIKTKYGEKDYDLSELLSKYDMQPNDEISFNVVSVTEDAFQIEIDNFSVDPSNMEVALFIKQDLSEVVVTKSFGDEFAKNLRGNKLADFQGLFKQLSPDENLLKTMNGYEIWDKKAKELVDIEENDYLNKSGEFVYLNGNELEDQTEHRIQRIEDYVDGNSEYYSEFKLDYEELGEEIGIDSAGAGIVEVMYLNDRYAVLYVNFALAITGTAGSTNVIVDLKDDTIYLVDLGLDVNTHAPISVSGE